MLKVLEIFVLGVLLFIILMVPHWRKVRKMQKAFKERDKNDLEHFLLSCQLGQLDKKDTAFVHAMRKSIASLADVPEESIYANDTFKTEMAYLPFWDSMDSLCFILELEENTGLNFEIDLFFNMKNNGIPDYRDPEYTIAHYVREYLEVYRKYLKNNIDKTSSKED